MNPPKTVHALEDFGRVQLSPNFFMRDFLFSEIAAIHGIPNIPDDPDLAIEAGRRLCSELLEPLHRTFGRVGIRSAYRSCAVNDFGNKNRLNCAKNEDNYAGHIWDRRDSDGCIGATACVVIPWYLPRYQSTSDWRPLAWWIHDHLPYSELEFYPKLAAFNVTWCERPKRTIYSHVPPHTGYLTRPGMDGYDRRHPEAYPEFPELM